MKFSAQEEYGLRCMVAIALKGKGGTMTIPELSAHEGLSQPHVAKLMTILRKAKFVNSTRGQVGGYSLARPPLEVQLSELLAILGGRLFEEGFCGRHAGLHDACLHEGSCKLHGLWNRVQNAVDDVLNGITLADVVSGNLADSPNVVFSKSPPKVFAGSQGCCGADSESPCKNT